MQGDRGASRAEGAGKTTTFYMVLGIVKPDFGRIMIDNDDLTGLPMYIGPGVA